MPDNKKSARPEPESQLLTIPKVKHYNVGFGLQANLDTVEIMKKLARHQSKDPLIRALALRILEHHNIPSHNYLDESRAIGEYVKAKIRYVRDIDGVEQLHSPIMLIGQIRAGQAQGDCDDHALLICALLLSIGHKPYLRIIKYRALAPTYQHIYVVDYANNKYGAKERIVLDAIVKDHPIGFEIPHKTGREIEV